jgi:hypothetical protein
MQYIGRCHNFVFLPVASNDNDDLLALNSPCYDLSLIRKIKWQLLTENMETGMLLASRKERRFFQEILDAERYIVMRYFTKGAPEEAIRALKYYIISSYLCPKRKRGRKKMSAKK